MAHEIIPGIKKLKIFGHLVKIFDQFFDFVLGEYNLAEGNSRSISMNFNSFWKWCPIPGFSKIFENDVKFQKFANFFNK